MTTTPIRHARNIARMMTQTIALAPNEIRPDVIDREAYRLREIILRNSDMSDAEAQQEVDAILDLVLANLKRGGRRRK